MKNFAYILFGFLIIFLLLGLNSAEPMYTFVTVFLAFILALICLLAYLGILRGLAVFIIFTILPFALEFLFYKYNYLNLKIFTTTTFFSLTKAGLATMLNQNTLKFIFLVPTLLICALFLAQKIRLYSLIKNYYLLFIIISAGLLFSLNFIFISPEQFSYIYAIKWLIIGLLTYFAATKLYKFKGNIHDTFKEIPIILFLILYGFDLLSGSNTYSILIALCLGIYYLILLYNEHKIRKYSEDLLFS